MVKIAHFYWGGNPLSYLRFLTVKSFIKYNPDWEVRFYVPRRHYFGDAEWVSHAHKIKYMGEDYMHQLDALGVNIQPFNFRAAGFREDVHEAYKSDFLRWYLLYHQGGFWSDMDVIFFKPLPAHIFKAHDYCITADIGTGVYYIAFIYSRRGSEISRAVLRAAMQPANFDPNNYQCLGNVLVKKCFPNPTISYKQHPKTFREHVHIFKPCINLPIQYIRDIAKIFENHSHIDLKSSVGFHWYGGHPMATKWENILTPEGIAVCNSNLCKLIRSTGL